mgnify:CR=1 FL=1
MSPLRVSEVEDDFNRLQLELTGPPLFEYLAVFIKDPRNPNQYWFRRINVKPGALEMPVRTENVRKGLGRLLKYLPFLNRQYTRSGDNTVQSLRLEYVNVGIPPMEYYHSTTVPENELPRVVEIVCKAERMFGRDDNLDVKNFQAAVGVARYNGTKQLSINEIAGLAGLKYHRIKASYLS